MSTNIALVLAKKLKIKPQDLANQIVEKINKYIKSNHKISIKSDSKLIEDIIIEPKNILEKIYVAGQGFINMQLAVDFLINHLNRLLRDEKPIKSTQTDNIIPQVLKNRKIMLEYTDPNPFKEFHIGHLYSNVIGESLSRLLESVGAEVWRADFYGDVGMHVAKSIWGMRELLKKEFLLKKTVCPVNQKISTKEEKELEISTINRQF